MIDFRYFLVSVSAIFLALAVGIVVGAGLLRGDVDQQLRAHARQAAGESEVLRNQLRAERRLAGYRDAVAAQLLPDLVKGTLSGTSVVLVGLPYARSETLTSVREAVESADATVTGTVAITSKWVDPDQRQFVDLLAARVGRRAGSSCDVDSPYSRASGVLAGAVLTTDPAATQADANTTTVLGAFAEADLIRAPADLRRAEYAIIVAPPAENADLERRAGGTAAFLEATQTTSTIDAWVALTRCFDAAGKGVVVAGEVSPGREAPAISAVREDVHARAEVSTVDVADLPSGHLAVVWALAEQRAGRVGHYGARYGIDGVLPRRPTAR